MSILDVTDYIKIVSELNVQPFFKGALVPLPEWVRQEIFVSQKYVKNVAAYLQSRKELHSSVFEEIHEHRFFLKKEFIQSILYGAH